MINTPKNIPQILQDLPPKWAHFCLHVEKFITDDLGVNLTQKCLITAFSGGVDSTALLLVLHYLSQKNGGRVIAVHLNHNLRNEAADETIWVQMFCDILNIDCVIDSVNIKSLAQSTNVGIEEAGRNARYTLFQKVLANRSADYIAIGHHLDDLCEDVLMRLTRGTGWPGLSGMAGYDSDRNLIRPLLMTPKTTLIEFLTDLGIDWCEDATNSQSEWMRNRIRNTLLPLFMKENPNFQESIARLWKLGKIEENYWDTQTADLTDSLSNEVLNEAHQALRLRLYKGVLDKLSGGQALADSLFKLDKAWQQKRYGSTFQFPGDKIATITATGVVFSHTH